MKGTVMLLFHGPDGPYISVNIGGAATLWYRSDAEALFDRLALGFDSAITISEADDARLRAPRRRRASAGLTLKDLGL